MKTILTAINNPKLNERIRQEKDIKVLYKDIQYKEAILEILEKNINIDIIIINENLPGEINLFLLLKKIQKINNKIKLIIILEKENEEKIKELKKININNIYLNNKINNKLIEIINGKKINKEKINNKIEKNTKNDNKINIKIQKEKIIKKIKTLKKSVHKTNKTPKVITIFGIRRSGKTLISLILAYYLSKLKYKVIIIDMDLTNQKLYKVLNKKINKNKLINKLEKNINKKSKYKIKKRNNIKNNIIKNKYKNNIKGNKIKIKNKTKKEINYKKIIEIFLIKINNNLYLFSNLNILLKNNKINNEKIIKKTIKYLKNKFNFIIIDLGNKNKKEFNKKILSISNHNIIMLEPTFLGIKQTRGLIGSYKKELKTQKNGVHIAINKNKINNINSKIISNIFSKIKIIAKIPYNNKIKYLINNKFKNKKSFNKIILKNKFKKIIKEIEK